MWGKEWAPVPTYYFVNGARVRYEAYCGSDCDDTAMNAIEVNALRYDWANGIEKVVILGQWVMVKGSSKNIAVDDTTRVVSSQTNK